MKKLKDLAAKPKLIRVVLDSEEIVKEYGEIEFWTYDRQPMHVFMKFVAVGEEDRAGMINILRTMILDENGQQILVNDSAIPSDVLVAAMQKISEVVMGKQKAEASTPQAKEQ